FHPNVCHICKKTDNGTFVTCSMCHMIYYCNKIHKNVHKGEHIQICTYIVYLLAKYKKLLHSSPLNTNEWLQSRINILKKLRRLLPRELQPYEEQMILFVKSCRTCHQQVQLRSCEICQSDYYCNEHKEEFIIEHTREHCRKLMTQFNLDITS
ncbi:hypothetical protein EAI_01803, partial [Harpegnathos saltator]